MMGISLARKKILIFPFLTLASIGSLGLSVQAQSLEECIVSYRDRLGLSADEAIRQCRRFGMTGISGGTRKKCAEASMEKKGWVDPGCRNLQNEAEERCATASIEKKGWVDPGCRNLQNEAEGRCAAASIERKGWVDPGCRNL
jgi:hypothetical protein